MRTISSPITISYSFFSSWSFGSSLYRCEMDENAAIVSACSSQPSSRANSRNDATRQVEKGGPPSCVSTGSWETRMPRVLMV